MYQDCLDGMGGIARWPDGGALLDQPQKLIQSFRVIGMEISKRRPK